MREDNATDPRDQHKQPDADQPPPQFYEYRKNSAVIDAERARQRLNGLNKRTGPRVGDFVWFPNEPNRGDSPTI